MSETQTGFQVGNIFGTKSGTLGYNQWPKITWQMIKSATYRLWLSLFTTITLIIISSSPSQICVTIFLFVDETGEESI